jgi:uncharacterized protein (DUF488 family)
MLYTLGYVGWRLDALQATLEATQAVLADIRYQPYSRNPTFRKAHLQAQLGGRYVHVPALGNRNYQGGPEDIVDYQRGRRIVAGLLDQWGAVLLMCACANVETCHRKGVAEQLSHDMDIPLTHLGRPDPPRPKERIIPMLF